MADVVIVGVRDFASLAHFYLRSDSPHQVVAFTVHRKFMPDTQKVEGLPIVPLEQLQRHFPNEECRVFAPMSHRNMNRGRAAVYRQLKEKGYEFVSYVSSRATVFSEQDIGDNCFILEDNTIQPFAKIGSNVVLWSGNHVGHHSVVEDHVFISSHVVISGHCAIEPYCFLGVNATIRDQVRLGVGSFIGMGACIMGDTKPWSVHRGLRAKEAKVTSEKVA